MEKNLFVLFRHFFTENNDGAFNAHRNLKIKIKSSDLKKKNCGILSKLYGRHCNKNYVVANVWNNAFKTITNNKKKKMANNRNIDLILVVDKKKKKFILLHRT